MPTVQSSDFNYKPFLEPTAFVSLSLLAGFTRVIEYLPGASRGGILLSGAMAATGSVIYNQMRLDPERNYVRTLLEKTAALALANIGAMLLAKPLQGRLSLCPTRKLGLVQFVFTAIATKLNKVTETPLTPLQKDHLKYNSHQREWRALSIEDRTKLAKDFYEGGLPGICLFKAPINVKKLNPVFTDYFEIESLEGLTEEEEAEPQPPITQAIFEKHLDSLSNQQLSWLREVLQGDSHLVRSLDPKIFYPLMQRFHNQGIETVRPPILNTPFLQNNRVYLDLLYKEFQKEPICELVLPEISLLFENKDSLPTLEDITPTLSKEKIQTMDPELVSMWYLELKNAQTLWNTLNPFIQSAFIQRFVEYKEFVPFHPNFMVDSLNIQWLNDFSEKELEELSRNQQQWVGNLLQIPKLQEQLSFKTTYTLNTHHGFRLPYKLTHEVIVAAEKDPDLLRSLYQQTWSNREEGKRQHSAPLFNLRGLSETDQQTLRALLLNKAY